MNKTCSNCGQINLLDQSFCQKCGKPFANVAPNNYGGQSDFQNQQGYNQANFNQQPTNFGQQLNQNQPNFNSPPKSRGKAAWWIGGGIGALLIIGVIVLAVIGIIVVGVNNIYDTPLEGTKWRSEVGATNIFGTNDRYTVISADGQKTLNGNMTISGHTVNIKVDNSNYATAYRWTIIGNKLTMIRISDNSPSVLTRIE